jgi:hypothetical protein
MPPVETYTLPSGTTIEVENLAGRGAREVSADRKGRLPLDKVLAPLGEVADLVLNQIRSAVKVPNTVTVELGASLKGKSSLVIVSGETEATFKVTLTWNNTSS